MENKRYFYITPEDFKKAKENGIHKETVITRVRKLGWDVDKAITKPARKKRKFTKEEIKIMEENGISYSAVNNRIKGGWDMKRACTERVKTRQESAKIARKKLKESREVGING